MLEELIKISTKNKKRLDEKGNKNDTYDAIIERMLDREEEELLK